MVSAWWVVVAFLLGAGAGTMVFALMAMASRQGEQAAKADETVVRNGLGAVDLEASWTAK